MGKRCYIPVMEHNYRIFTCFDRPYWVPIRKIPIDNIKIDKSLMDWPNDVAEEQVQTIIEYFNVWHWLPIIINKDYYLLNGQHRLEVARRLKLRFIDAVVENVELLDSPPVRKKHRKGWL
jgi:hypothetical protein